MTAETTHDWRLRGTVLIACNCDYGCPCNFNARPTKGHCEGGWTWHLEDAHLGDLRLDGLACSVYCDWPAAIHDGNGVAQMLIDERADDQQRAALERFLRGEIGGPWAILVHTFTTIHGPDFVPFDLSLPGERSQVRVGEVIEIATRPIRNPVTGVEVHPRAVLPEGFVTKDAALLTTDVFRARGEVAYDHSGQYAALGAFDYRPA